MPALTSNDSAVLHALFDAESSPSSAISIDPTLPPLPQNLQINQTDHEALSTREKSIISSIQDAHGSSAARTIHAAIEALNTLIKEHPTYPSAYVNRAQALRMLVDSDGDGDAATKQKEEKPTLFNNPANATTSSRLLADLGHAITLSTPSSPVDPVSSVQARILADAHTHRGYLLLKAARAKKDVSYEGELKTRGSGSGSVWDLGPDQLEEMASRDFFFGGRYGNKIAQQLAVQTNPYAKMCGAIVKEAMKKETEGAAGNGGFSPSIRT